MIVILINAISSGGCHEIGGGKDSLFGPCDVGAVARNGFGAAVLFVMSSEPVAVAMVINLLVGIMRWRSCCQGGGTAPTFTQTQSTPGCKNTKLALSATFFSSTAPSTHFNFERTAVFNQLLPAFC